MTSSSNNPENIYKIPDAARNYQLLREIPKDVCREYSERAISYLPNNGTILEAGFGTAHVLLEIARAGSTKGVATIGVDNSNEMHFIANEKIKDANLDNIQLVNSSLGEYLLNNPETLDGIHFKAILHCFKDPISVLESMHTALKPGGVIITGHEASQTESRIERLYGSYPFVDDFQLEVVLGYYFEIRAQLSYSSNSQEKDFKLRQFPAGDSTTACEFFKKKGYEYIGVSSSDEMHFERSYTIDELLKSIKSGTFGVFRDGLTEDDLEYLFEQVKAFTEREKIDTTKVRKIPARWQQYALRKPTR